MNVLNDLYCDYFEVQHVLNKFPLPPDNEGTLFRLPDTQELEFVIHSASVVDNDPNIHWCFYVPVCKGLKIKPSDFFKLIEMEYEKAQKNE